MVGTLRCPYLGIGQKAGEAAIQFDEYAERHDAVHGTFQHIARLRKDNSFFGNSRLQGEGDALVCGVHGGHVSLHPLTDLDNVFRMTDAPAAAKRRYVNETVDPRL